MSAASRPHPLADRGGGDAGESQALAAAHAQGRQLAEDGDLTGARTLMEEALAVAELRLGRDHPHLAPIMVDLATIARNLGNLTEAQNQLRRSYGIIVASSGPEHATALSVEGRLAAVTDRLGEPTEAYDWHLADVGVRVLGADHPSVRGARQRLTARPAPMPEADLPRERHVVGRIHDPDEPPEPQYAGANPHQPPEGYEPHEYHEPGYAPTFAPGVYQRPAAPPGLYQPHPTTSASYLPHPSAPGVYQRHPSGDERTPAHAYADAYPDADDSDNFDGSDNSDGSDDSGYADDAGYAGYADEYGEPAHVARRARPRRGGVALVVSLGVVVLVAATIVGVQLLRPSLSGTGSGAGSGGADGPANPTVASTGVPGAATAPTQPPARVTLTDNGGSVTLTWSDPGAGQVSFLVRGGRVGEVPTPYDTVPAGRTTSTIYGLNHLYDYCFTVAAVWSSSVIAPSVPTCTRRLSTGGPA